MLMGCVNAQIHIFFACMFFAESGTQQTLRLALEAQAFVVFIPSSCTLEISQSPVLFYSDFYVKLLRPWAGLPLSSSESCYSSSVICFSDGFHIAASQALNLSSVSPQELTVCRYMFVTDGQTSNLEK